MKCEGRLDADRQATRRGKCVAQGVMVFFGLLTLVGELAIESAWEVYEMFRDFCLACGAVTTAVTLSLVIECH